MRVGGVIKKRREALGWSQQELAEKSGLSSAADISRIERGRQWPTEAKLNAIAAALGCRLSQLFADLDQWTEGAVAPVFTEGRDVGYKIPKAPQIDDLVHVIGMLNLSIAEVAASSTRALQILTFAIARASKQGVALLTSLREERDRVRAEPNHSRMLLDTVDNMIAQLMREASSLRKKGGR